MAVALALSMALAQRIGDKFGVEAKVIEGPMASRTMTFTDALKAGAMALRSHFLNFGIELADRDSVAEPVVFSAPPQGGTVGEYIENIFDQVPTYEYEIVSQHTVSVFPRGAKDDPHNILNLRVPRFDVQDQHAGWILGFPSMFIPELDARLFPPTPGKQHKQHITMFIGPVPQGPKVTVHLRDVSIREILNAVSVATERPKGDGRDDAPYGWIYRSTTPAGEKKPYFGVIATLPPNWRDLVFPGPATPR